MLYTAWWKMNKLKLSIVLFGILVISSVSFGQSIYSRIGVGEIRLPQSARAQGMGVVGIASVDYNEISLINPATWHYPRLTGLTTKLYTGRYTNSAGAISDHLGFEGFNFHFPVGETIGVGLGFTPYSVVRYQFKRDEAMTLPDDGTATSLQYSYTQNGQGGVGANYIGVGFQLTENLSLGMAFTLLSGEISVQRRIDFDEDDYLSRGVYSTTTVNGKNIVAGVSYRNLFVAGDNLGVRAEIPLSLSITREDEYFTEDLTVTEYDDFLWPWHFGVGYQTQFLERWIGIIDGGIWRSPDDLSVITLRGTDYSQEDGMRLGLGVERQPDFDRVGWLDRVSWRAGLTLQELLFTTSSGKHIYDVRLVSGIGIPVGSGPLGPGTDRFDFNLFYNYRATPGGDAPNESLFGVEIGFTVSEIWF